MLEETVDLNPAAGGRLRHAVTVDGCEGEGPRHAVAFEPAGDKPARDSAVLHRERVLDGSAVDGEGIDPPSLASGGAGVGVLGSVTAVTPQGALPALTIDRSVFAIGVEHPGHGLGPDAGRQVGHVLSCATGPFLLSDGRDHSDRRDGQDENDGDAVSCPHAVNLLCRA